MFIMYTLIVVSAVLVQFAAMKLWLTRRDFYVLPLAGEIVVVTALTTAICGMEIGKAVFVGLIAGTVLYIAYELLAMPWFRRQVHTGEIRSPYVDRH